MGRHDPVTYEETQRLLREPWQKGHLKVAVHYQGEHPIGEPVRWKLYHNDPNYISIQLLSPQGTPIVEFTETPDRVVNAEAAVEEYFVGDSELQANRRQP